MAGVGAARHIRSDFGRELNFASGDVGNIRR
jgi:hypothetical protein